MQKSLLDEVILFSCAICCPAEQQILSQVVGEFGGWEEEAAAGKREQGAMSFFGFIFLHLFLFLHHNFNYWLLFDCFISTGDTSGDSDRW